MNTKSFNLDTFPKEGLKGFHRKDLLVHSYKLIVQHPNGLLHEVIDLRLSKANKNGRLLYACLWIKHDGKYASGSGSVDSFNKAELTYVVFRASGIKLSDPYWDCEPIQVLESFAREFYPESSFKVVEAYP